MNFLHLSWHLPCSSKWWPCLVWCLQWPRQVMVQDGEHIQLFQETQEGKNIRAALNADTEYESVGFRTPSPPACRSCWIPGWWSVGTTQWRRRPGSLPGCRVSYSSRHWRTTTDGRCFSSDFTARYLETLALINWRTLRKSCWRWEHDTSLIGNIKSPAYALQTFIIWSPRYSGLLITPPWTPV